MVKQITPVEVVERFIQTYPEIEITPEIKMAIFYTVGVMDGIYDL